MFLCEYFESLHLFYSLMVLIIVWNSTSNIRNNQTYFYPSTWTTDLMLLVERVRIILNFNQFNDLHENIGISFRNYITNFIVFTYFLTRGLFKNAEFCVFIGMIHGLNHVYSKYGGVMAEKQIDLI